MPNKAPKRRLKNLTVEFISLVDAGANKREVIYKNADADQRGTQIVKHIQFRKADEEKRLVYGVVYAPDETDSHDDTMTASEIEKAAHAFLAAGKTNRVDKQHDENPDKGYIVESSILKGEHPEFPDDPEGTWIVAIKVTDDDTWEEIKKGDIKGISMQGYAEAEELEQEVTKTDSVLAAINEMKQWIRKQFNMPTTDPLLTTFAEIRQSMEDGTFVPALIQKDFEGAMSTNKVRQAVHALDTANWSVLHDDDIEDKKAALIMNAEQFKEYLNGLDIAKSTTTKTEDEPMSDEKNPTTEVEKSEVEKSPELLAIEKLSGDVSEKIAAIDERLQAVEKSAGGSQANAGQQEEVEKSYNPKAPLSFGIN